MRGDVDDRAAVEPGSQDGLGEGMTMLDSAARKGTR